MKMLTSFIADKSGAAGVLFALSAIPLTVIAGGGVDLAKATNVQLVLQAQADSAAIRLATMGLLATGSQRQAAAEAMFTEGKAATPVVTVSFNGTTTTVTATGAVKTSFLGLVGKEAIPVAAKSSAVLTKGGPTSCIMALNRTASGSVTIAGSSTLIAEGCAIYSNSASPSAIMVQGSATVQAAGFCAVGGVSSSVGLAPAPLTGCMTLGDPFAGLQFSVGNGCAYNNMQVQPSQTKSLSPGVYCGGLTIKGAATLAPGVYVIKDGPLVLNSQANVSGSGVTFYLLGSNAGFTINAGGVVALSAPTTGAYSGMLIVQDAASNVGGGNTLNGGADMLLTGAIYTPTQSITLNGGSSFGQNSPFMPLVADQIKFSGNTTAKIDTSKMSTVQSLPTLLSGARLSQ